jgi:hypothetical protein
VKIAAMQNDEELERLVLAYSPRLRVILESGRQQIREGKGLSHEDFWHEVTEEKPTRGRSKGRAKTA